MGVKSWKTAKLSAYKRAYKAIYIMDVEEYGDKSKVVYCEKFLKIFEKPLDITIILA